jgi:hypothetical protein
MCSTIPPDSNNIEMIILMPALVNRLKLAIGAPPAFLRDR